MTLDQYSEMEQKVCKMQIKLLITIFIPQLKLPRPSSHHPANNPEFYSSPSQVMGLEMSLNILLYGVDLGMYLVTPTQARPQYSPLPFENKLYFQENLSKYLREKYPKLNVSALRVR